jgi:putative endonuclease
MQEVIGSTPIFSTTTATISIVAVFCYMTYYVYILYSTKTDRFYVGSCQNINERLIRHNAGYSKSTKAGSPWVLRFKEVFETRSAAVKREIEIKRKKSRIYIEYLITSTG